MWIQKLASLVGEGWSGASSEREVSTDKGPRADINRLLYLADQPLIAEDEDRAERHFRKGLELREKGKWKRAIAEFDKAVSKNPNHVEARTQRGFASAKLGEPNAGRTPEKATQQPSSDSPQQGERYCSNCRRFLAAGTSTCEYCGQPT